jgi:DNA adenine methylase
MTNRTLSKIEPRIVNVATVPQRSPFRYPGGKTWLVPQLRQWLSSLPCRPVEFIEPFCGGGILGLTVAFERLADHVLMSEIDSQVAAVWRTILSDKGLWLANRVRTFELTQESAKDELARVHSSSHELAFQTLLRNRVHHGGILAHGSGMIKHGENGKGIKSRWYPETLEKRILSIAAIRDRITFVQDDGLELIRQNAHREDVVYLLDPPYTAGKNGKRAGRRLYAHSELDHEELFSLAEAIKGEFLMTYDNDAEVRILASRHGFDARAIPMKNTHHAEMTELLIGRDQSWMDARPQNERTSRAANLFDLYDASVKE